MRELRPEDYEKLSQHVVDAFLTHDVPLSQGVIKVAAEMELNPNQIRNLTQLANVNAHLRLFEKQAGDKVVEFVPVDPSDVIQSLYQNEQTEKTAAACDGYNRELDFYGSFETSPTTKEASTPVVLEERPAHGRSHPVNMLARLRKVAEELNSQKLQNVFAYSEELDKLASDFAKLYGPDYGVFEKDALCKYGSVAVPTLNDIRSKLRMNPIPVDAGNALQKTARLVNDTTPEMKSLDTLLKLSSVIANHARGLAYLKEQAGDVL